MGGSGMGEGDGEACGSGMGDVSAGVTVFEAVG
jgi:hypothetical protein